MLPAHARSVIQYNDAKVFCEQVLGRLLQAEAENCRLISLAMRLVEKQDRPPVRRFWSVESAAGVELVALQKSDALLEISRGPNKAAELLVNALIADGGTSAIAGPAPTIETVALNYSLRGKVNRKLHRRYRVHTLAHVLPPARVAGAMHRCDEADHPLLRQFIDAYVACINEPSYAHTGAVANDLIAGKRMFFWRNPRPVAMAAWAGPTPNGVRINFVYTPAEFRGRGYASNLVAGLSQRLLDEGRRSCYLFTDRSNARAEHVYARIGYQPVSDGEHWIFESTAN